jgi:hypothetical protein
MSMTTAQVAAVSFLARYAAHTHELYSCQLHRWFEWCEGNGLDPLVGIQRAHVELCIRSLGEAGLMASSTNTMMHGVRGIGTVAYTSAAPKLSEAYPKLASALSTIATARFLGATHFVTHPRRWAWMLAALDTQNRPLAVPSDGAVNAAGLTVTGDAQGVVGRLLGCTVITDPSIPVTLGGGTEDIVIAARLEDVWPFESLPRFRVLLASARRTSPSAFRCMGISL